LALALLGWVQLRQYSTPLTQAGIDPLLAVTPTLAVVAGAVLALRLLPPLTGLAERLVDRGRAVAATLGMWQAGRRPQAGPVLLITLAVAASTVAWCLLDTSERSLADQADHAVGADVRLVESSRFAPAERWGQVADLPGVARSLPVWRDEERLGADGVPTSMVALDAGAAAGVVRLRPDLADDGPAALFAGLVRARPATPGIALPAGTRHITGTADAGVLEAPTAAVRTYAVLTAAGGGHRRLQLAETRSGAPRRFDAALPADLGPAVLVGFTAETAAPAGSTVQWSLTDVDAGGPLALPTDSRWRGRDLTSGGGMPFDPIRSGLTTTVRANAGSFFTQVVPVRFGVSAVPATEAAERDLAVPVVATPAALDVLHARVGDRTRVSLGQGEFDVVITGTVSAVPTTGSAALLADLPSLATALFTRYGTVRDPQEWWLSTRPGGHGEAAAAAAALRRVEVQDRLAVADRSGQDPYGAGARAALFAAAIGAILIAALTISVGLRANARRRAGEYAVLRAFGAGPRLLIRSLVAEQALLAGGGTLAGLAVGAAVAVAMAPLIILTPTATRPVPEPLVRVLSLPVAASAATLFLVAVALSALVATTARRDLVAARVRTGVEA
jgi:hypothetical protein